MDKFLKPEVFFHRLRPFLAGFTSGPYADWGGIVFQGIHPDPKPFSGGSAAQGMHFSFYFLS